MPGNQVKTESSESKLPAGVVLGPDGKPCKVCSAFRTWSKEQKTSHPEQTAPTAASALAALGLVPSKAVSAPPLALPPNCPPDSEALGRATWTFLHTTAAYYPPQPNPQQKRHMVSLLKALPALYPCSYCALHLGEEMERNPPNVQGGAALSLWLCKVHNEVNERLGKEPFDCSRVFERWKDGWKDGSCD